MARLPLATEHWSGSYADVRKVFDLADANFLELYNGAGSAGSANILLSTTYNLVGDNSTDNNTQILAWIAAATALTGAGQRVEMILEPGVYRTSGRHSFPSLVDLRFRNAQLQAIGTDTTAPLITLNGGNAFDIYVGNLAASFLLDRRFVGFRWANAQARYARILAATQFTVGVQLYAGNGIGICSYNTMDIGTISSCKYPLELVSAEIGTPFVSENVFRGGNIIATSGMNNGGSSYGMTILKEWDNSYSSNSGNIWLKPSFQLQPPNLSWTSGGSATAGRFYYGPLTGLEWYCKTSGTFSATEPSTLPTGANRVDLTSITTAVGNPQITVSSTTGISAGWHMRGTNPLSNFPWDTFVLTVDDATHLTLTQPASQASSTYKATFTAITTDNTAGLVVVGPYRRSPLRMQDCGSGNGIYDARRETGTGEAIICSGPHMWPMATSGTQTWESFLTQEAESSTTVKVNIFPKWVANTAYALGDMASPLVAGAIYWECIVAGTSHASTEPTVAGTPGKTTVDNGVTWIERAMVTSLDRGDIGVYTGSSLNPKIHVRHFVEPPIADTFHLDNLHLRGIGSATGWLVQGACKNVTGGGMSQSWASGDFSLSRDGLILNSTASQIGFLIRTDKHKYYKYRKNFGPYSSQRARLMAYDKAYAKMNCTNTQPAYNTRILANMAPTGAFEIAEGTDLVTFPDNFLVGTDVPYVFFGINKGSTGTPTACVLNGISISALPCESTNVIAPRAECFTPYGSLNTARSSLGIPTSGYFMAAGEFIQNASTGVGVTQGHFVATAGILAPAWAPGVVYVKGQLVSVAASNRVYAANGSFNSGLAFTFTGALVAATSGTLSSNWNFATGSYTVLFSDASTRVCTFTNGATTCTWSGAVTATASATVGTLPSGTASNFLDTTAQSIVSGDVATWDYIAPLAVLTASAALN